MKIKLDSHYSKLAKEIPMGKLKDNAEDFKAFIRVKENIVGERLTKHQIMKYITNEAPTIFDGLIMGDIFWDTIWEKRSYSIMEYVKTLGITKTKYYIYYNYILAVMYSAFKWGVVNGK